MDGADATLASFTDDNIHVVRSLHRDYPPAIRRQLMEITSPGWTGSLATLQDMDHQIGLFFAEICRELIAHCGKTVAAIGFHGQTIHHQPSSQHPNSWQIGDPNLIAETTGITTIADWRRRDIAAGGQGAPLTPLFHAVAFRRPHDTVVLNLGGIANISLLSESNEKCVRGFDCGPANALMDDWIHRHLGKDYDRDGAWASSGQIIPSLLQSMLSDPYFSRPPPKSTGREHFNRRWLQHHLDSLSTKPTPADVQTTLAELTARTVVDAIKTHAPDTREVFLCGGGAYNRFLINRMEKLGQTIKWRSSLAAGIPPEDMEAIAFAWFAKQTMEGKALQTPAVTGARHARIAGAIYPGSGYPDNGKVRL